MATKNPMAAWVAQVVDELLNTGAYRATKYVDQNLTIKATKKNYGNKRRTKGTIDLVVTIGKPNFKERKFIATARAAGEPFPVKKVLLQAWPVKKGK